MTVSYRKREERKYDPRRKRRRIFLQDKSLLKSEGDMGEKGGEVFHDFSVYDGGSGANPDHRGDVIQMTLWDDRMKPRGEFILELSKPAPSYIFIFSEHIRLEMSRASRNDRGH